MPPRVLMLSPLPAGGLSWSPAGGLLLNLLPASGLSYPPLGPPGEPAACWWPIMAPRGPPGEPAACGWPRVGRGSQQGSCRGVHSPTGPVLITATHPGPAHPLAGPVLDAANSPLSTAHSHTGTIWQPHASSNRRPPGLPAACGWPVMAPRALLLNPLPAGGLSWSPGGLLVKLLPAGGLSCSPGGLLVKLLPAGGLSWPPGPSC